MRIGFFTDTYRPYISGAVTSMENSSLQLRALGHEVTTFAPRYPQSPDDAEGITKFPSFAFPGYEGLRITAPFPKKKLDQNFRLDIVHAHSPFIMGRLGSRFAQENNLPTVFTCHSLYPEYSQYAPFLTSLVETVIEDYLVQFCNKCQRIIAPSEIVKSTIKNWGVAVPISVVPTGIDTTNFRSGLDSSWVRRSFGVSEGDKMLLYVGRLAKEKRLGFLLRSFGKLIHADSDRYHLVLAGEGPELPELRLLATKLRIAHKVTFAGPLPHEKVVSCYKEADLFLFASTIETQGLVLMEAMTAGLPVVAVDSAVTREVVTHGNDGFIVANSEDAMMRSIVELNSSEDLLREVGQRAAERARQFTVEFLTKRLLQAYEETITDWKSHAVRARR